jgi:hypothetical protein
VFATDRDSLRELNPSDLALLETRFRTLVSQLEVKLESSISKKHWDMEFSLIKKNWDMVEWMFLFFGAYVVATTVLVFILAEIARR